LSISENKKLQQEIRRLSAEVVTHQSKLRRGKVASMLMENIAIGADLGKILGAQLSPPLPLFNGGPGYNPGKIFEITDARR
jgi:hypothetical protein